MTEPTIFPTELPEAARYPGIASGMSVRAVVGAGSEKQVAVEKLSNRHTVACFDRSQGRYWAKVKVRIEHMGQQIWELGYKRDSWRGTKYEKYTFVVVLSAWQEVWAADERGAPARWISAKDLLPGRHVLKLDFNPEGGDWAELVWATTPKRESFQNVPVHELVLIDCDWFKVDDDVLCRAKSVPAPPPVKKRMVYPLKDFPLINFVPQPKTLGHAQAEIWYRQSAALLPRCIGETAEPIERVHAMLVLKRRMLEVAAKATIETTLRDEFIQNHPLPTLEALIPNHDQLSPNALKDAIEIAVLALSAPGDRHYSEFCGGMESYRVWSEDGYWEFDGDNWIQAK